MSEQTYDWVDANIVAKITYIPPGNSSTIEHECEMANRIYVKENYPVIPIHGINHYGNGVKELPPQYTFIVAFPATSASTRLLRALQVTRQPFSLYLYDKSNSNEYKLYGEILEYCRLTTKEVSIVVGDVPLVTFSGIALRHTFYINESEKVKDNNTEIAFGSGATLTTNINIFDEWLPSQQGGG